MPNKKDQVIGARHFIATYVTSIMLQGANLVQSVILARMLGAEGRGEYAAIILWPTIIANIGNLGTGLATTRAAAAASDDLGPVVRTSILLSMLLSSLTIGIGLVLLPFLVPDGSSRVAELAKIYMLLFIPSFNISANLAGVDQGQGNFWRLNFFRLMQSPINVMFLVVLIVIGKANLINCLWSLVVSTWLVSLGRLFLLLKDLPLLGKIYSPFNLMKEGLPFALGNVLGQFIHRGDQVLLLWLLTERDLGLYVVAYNVASILANLAQSISMVMMTITAKEKVGEGFARVAQIFRGTVVISILVGLVQVVAVYIILPILYGDDFENSRLISVILAMGIMLMGMSSVLGQGMRGQGKPLKAIAPNLASLAVMAMVSFALSPSLGVFGVALGYVASQATRTIGWMLMTVRHYNDASMSAMVPREEDVKLVYRRINHIAMNGFLKAKKFFNR